LLSLSYFIKDTLRDRFFKVVGFSFIKVHMLHDFDLDESILLWKMVSDLSPCDSFFPISILFALAGPWQSIFSVSDLAFSPGDHPGICL
jgi:hypothetical protein